MRQDSPDNLMQGPRTIAEFYNSGKLFDVLSKVKGLTNEQITQLSVESYVPTDSIEKMAETVSANGVGVGFRPVNEAAQNAIKKHNAVGKGFDIKGKSADQGPLEGLVPKDQAFGKLGSADYKNMTSQDKQNYIDTIKKFQHYNKDVLDDKKGYGTYIPKNEQGQEYYGFLNKDGVAIKGPDGKMVFATRQADKSFINEHGVLQFQSKVTHVVLEAMGYVTGEDDKGNKIISPVTADADQLTQGIIDRTTNNIITDQSVTSKIGVANEQGAALTRSLIDDTKEKGMVRHSDESGNPFPEDFANGKPHLFLLPKPIRNKDGIIEKIKTVGKVFKTEKEIMDNLYNNPDYNELGFKANAMWGWERNQEGKLQIDPNRVNAQALSLKMSQYKENGDIEKYKDAEAITRTMREIGTLKLSPLDTKDRSKSIENGEKKLQIQQKSFIKKYDKEDFLDNSYKLIIKNGLSLKEKLLLQKQSVKQAKLDIKTEMNIQVKGQSNKKMLTKAGVLEKKEPIKLKMSSIAKEPMLSSLADDQALNKTKTSKLSAILRQDPSIQNELKKSLKNKDDLTLSVQSVKIGLGPVGRSNVAIR